MEALPRDSTESLLGAFQGNHYREPSYWGITSSILTQSLPRACQWKHYLEILAESLPAAFVLKHYLEPSNGSIASIVPRELFPGAFYWSIFSSI